MVFHQTLDVLIARMQFTSELLYIIVADRKSELLGRRDDFAVNTEQLGKISVWQAFCIECGCHRTWAIEGSRCRRAEDGGDDNRACDTCLRQCYMIICMSHLVVACCPEQSTCRALRCLDTSRRADTGSFAVPASM